VKTTYDLILGLAIVAAFIVIAKWMIDTFDDVAPSLSVGPFRFAIEGRRNLRLQNRLLK
jgi:hypothetical protein